MIIDFYKGAGGGSGSGYTLPIATETRLGGIKVGSGLSIDGSTGVLSVSGGSQSGPTVIDFDAMTQAELEALYGELSGVTSANTINQDYIFIKAFYDYSYSSDLGPIKLQYIGPSGDRICFGSANYNKSRNELFVFGVWLTSDGSIDSGFDTYNKGLSGINNKPIFRDYWHLYYDTTTSGFSFDTDGSLTPITYGTGNTCSGMWQFDADSMPSFLNTPGLNAEGSIGWFGVKINTAEGVRRYAYPSFSYVQLNSAVTFTDSDGNTQSLDKKAYFDYGEFVVSLYYNGEWRFGGLEIKFRTPQVVLTQAQYDALVQAGTVDPNTVYVII